MYKHDKCNEQDNKVHVTYSCPIIRAATDNSIYQYHISEMMKNQ